jgi:hypothetical protein
MIALLALLLTFSSGQVIKKNLYQRVLGALQIKSEPKGNATQALLNEKDKKATATPTKKERSSIPAPRPQPGNLPIEYQDPGRFGFRANDNPVILPSTPKKQGFRSLPFGEVIDAEITESLIAFPDLRVPARAKVRRGPLSGSVFLGEAALEKNSKRVIIDFKKFRPLNSEVSYSITAAALDFLGTYGIEGEYHSGEAKYFSAEFLASLAAGYSDAFVEKSVTPYGQYVDVPDADNAAKKSVSNALSKTADRFAEKIRQTQEFTTVTGPISIQILTQSDPKQLSEGE